VTIDRRHDMLAGMPDNRFWDELAGPPSSPEQAQARRQRASQARLDHALGLVGQAVWLAELDQRPRGELLLKGSRSWPGCEPSPGSSMLSS
jgi:hypothetical protein